MKVLKKENEWISTIIAFSLIPISGFAMDVYVPSFPDMVQDLNTGIGSVRYTLSIFLVSYGLSQLFVGSLVDSFGRYKLSLLSNVIFILSNVVIATTHNIDIIIVMRAVQGFVISIMMVSKRSFFIDVYSGDKVKHYTSLLSIVWSVAPIVAPFVGGYLQTLFGWRANFCFLAIYGLAILLLDLRFGGETIKTPRPFKLSAILEVYKTFFSARDFVIGIVILGLSYSTAIVFGMASPFIIEHDFHLTPVVTGYSALASGVALFFGGLLSKKLITKPFFSKIRIANLLQVGVAIIMFLTASRYYNLISLIGFVATLHFLMGFIYNIYFKYCLTKFSANAGAAGGVTSGGAYIVTSIASGVLVSLVNVHDQRTLAICYITISAVIGVLMFFIPAHLKNKK